MNGRHGMTLMEVMVGLGVGLVVIGGVVRIGASHFFNQQMIRDNIGVTSDRTEAGITAMRIAHLLARADRVNILSEDPGHIQYRRFVPQQDAPPACPAGSCTTPSASTAACCFDIAANYQWDELRYDAASRELIQYPGNALPRCSKAITMSGYLTTVVFRYQDTAAPAPPGADADPGLFSASPADMNMVAFSVKWDDGKSLTRDFNSTVSMRGAPYSDVLSGAAGLGDSGIGLDATSVASPPVPACP